MDSSVFQKDVRDVAEFLYSILTDNMVAKNGPTLIVACNKQGKRFNKCAHLNLTWPVIEKLPQKRKRPTCCDGDNVHAAAQYVRVNHLHNKYINSALVHCCDTSTVRWLLYKRIQFNGNNKKHNNVNISRHISMFYNLRGEKKHVSSCLSPGYLHSKPYLTNILNLIILLHQTVNIV